MGPTDESIIFQMSLAMTGKGKYPGDILNNDKVIILKEKKGIPTVIEWNGKKYVLHHSDQFKR